MDWVLFQCGSPFTIHESEKDLNPLALNSTYYDTKPTTDSEPEPVTTTYPEPEPMPATELEPAATFTLEAKPIAKSDQVVAISFPVGILVELDEEEWCPAHPLALEICFPPFGVTDALISSCFKALPPQLVPSSIQVSLFSTDPAGFNDTSSPLVLRSFQVS